MLLTLGDTHLTDIFFFISLNVSTVIICFDNDQKLWDQDTGREKKVVRIKTSL